jgi:SSS family solute:Na+ symporter
MKKCAVAIVVSMILLGFARQIAAADDAPAKLPESNTPLKWTNLPPLPDKFGLGGPIVGVHNDVLIVAGGANFPDGAPWKIEGVTPGKKVWHSDVLVLEDEKGVWKKSGQLPASRAYSACVSTSKGIYAIGGETFGKPDAKSEATNYPVADVVLLTWDKKTKKVVVTPDALPPLPRASVYHAAGVIGTKIFVTASHAASEKSDRLDVKSFWMLDLSQPNDQRKWENLKPWPGAARHKMVVAVQAKGADDHYLHPKCLYLFSGSTWVKNAEGENDLALFEFFNDAYRYQPETNVWSRIADIPSVPERRTVDSKKYAFDAERRVWKKRTDGQPASPIDVSAIYARQPRAIAAGTAAPTGQSHILLFSGATGRFITMDGQDIPLFSTDVLAYHTITDRWVRAGEMPQGVVTTTAVTWKKKIVIPSGEIRPALRTPNVQTVEPKKTSFEFGTVNMIVVVVYLAALVGMGFYFSRREKGTDDYFLAGRRIPWWAAGMSIYATQLSAMTFIGLPAVPYASNWLLYPGQLMIFAMAPIVVIFYLPFFRRLNVTTAYEYLERRFNVAARLFGSLSFIVFQFFRMAIVVYLPAMALSAITGIDVYTCILVMGVLSIVYTVLGGMEAVIWTDVMQVIVLWGGMLFALVLIVSDVGGISAVYETAKADGKLTMFNWDWSTVQMATWLLLVGNMALQFGPYTTDQAVIQRYMTTRDEKAAARSIWLNGALTLPFAILFFTLGTALYVFFKSHPEMLTIGMDNDAVFPIYIANQLPVGVAGLVIAGIFAASMSSLDSSMHSVSTALVTDFYQRFHPDSTDEYRLKLARWITVLVGVIGTATAMVVAGLDIRSMFVYFQKLMGLLTSGLVGLFILGIFTRRANAVGSLLGAASSFVVLGGFVYLTKINGYLYPVIGISTAVVVGYVASLVLPSHSVNLAGLTLYTQKKKSE